MNYDVFVFDFDGTLYYQMPVRIYMAFRMLVHYFLRPRKIRELFTVLTYRKLRGKLFGKGTENFNELQINEAAKLCGVTPEHAERVINFWMTQQPLKAVKFFRRKKLLEVLKKFQTSGKIIIVYSDYPVKEKLNAVNFQPDKYYWSNDGFINCMKPDASGLVRVIKTLGLNGKKILYVGDSYDKDGICAKEAGLDYLDVRIFQKNFSI